MKPQTSLAGLAFGFSLLTLSVAAGTYTTTFPVSETPLKENGMWVNGSLTGKHKDCAVTNIGGFHYAFGLQPGTNRPPVYDDSLAVLTGTWGPTQALDLTVYCTNQQPSTAGYWEEIEYGLNCVLSNHWFSGYFMDLSLNSDSGYIELGISYQGTNNVGLGGNVRGRQYVVTNGSTLHVGLTNKTISVFLNGRLAARVTDTTGISIPNGAPCIGFYHQGDKGSKRTDFGISRFSATDFMVAPLQIRTRSLTNGSVGNPYSAQLAASGGVAPYRWSLVPGSGPLPGGLSLSAGGVLSGTPTNAATFEFSIRVTDAQSITADVPLVLTIGTGPSISGIGNQLIAVNRTIGPLAFTVADAETPPANLVVSAGSDNPALVPVANIVLAGHGYNRTISLSPVVGATGSANITLSVSDGVATASTNFELTVLGRPHPPRNLHVVTP